MQLVFVAHPGPGEVSNLHVFDEAVNFGANFVAFAAPQAAAKTLPEADTTFTIYHLVGGTPTDVGTVKISTTGVVTFVASSFSVAVGDSLYAETPTPIDGAIADIAIAFAVEAPSGATPTESSLSFASIPAGPDPTGELLGVDLSALSNSGDLDPKFPTLTGMANLGEALARRLMTPRGGLFYAPNYGTDVRDYLNDNFTNAQLAALQAAVEAECEKDDRVSTASCVATFDPTTSSLALALSLTTAAGPYQLVLGVDAVTVSLLDSSLS